MCPIQPDWGSPRCSSVASRLVLAPGATSRATVVLPVSSFASDAGGSPTVVAGNYVVDIGESSADLPIHLPVAVPAQAA